MIEGTGFGTQQGTVDIGPFSASVVSWSDTSISATVAIPAGRHVVHVHVPEQGLAQGQLVAVRELTVSHISDTISGGISYGGGTT